MSHFQTEGSDWQDSSLISKVNPSSLKNNKIGTGENNNTTTNSCSNNISKQAVAHIQTASSQQNVQQGQAGVVITNQPHSPITTKNGLNYTRRNFLKHQQQYLEQNNISIPNVNISTNKSPTNPNGGSAGSVVLNILTSQQQQQQQQQQQLKQSANHIQNLMQIYTPNTNKAIKRRIVAPNHSSLNRRTYTESEDISTSPTAAMYTQQENILNASIGNPYIKSALANNFNNGIQNYQNSSSNNNVSDQQNIKTSNNNGLFCISNKRGSTNNRKPFLQLSNQQASSFISTSNQSNSYLQSSCVVGGVNPSSLSNNNPTQTNMLHNKSIDRHADRPLDLPSISTPSSQIEKKNFQIGILQQQQQQQLQSGNGSANHQSFQPQQQALKQQQQSNLNTINNHQAQINQYGQLPLDSNNNNNNNNSNNRASSLSSHINQPNNQHEFTVSPIHTPYGQNVNNRGNILRMKSQNDRKSVNAQNDDQDDEPTFSSIQNPNDYFNQASPQNYQYHNSNGKQQQFMTIQQGSQKNKQSDQSASQNNENIQNIVNNIQNITIKNQRINYNICTPTTTTQTPSSNNSKKYVFQQNRPSQNYSSNTRSIRESSFATRASSPFQKTVNNVKMKAKIKIQNNNFVKRSQNNQPPSTPPRQGSVLFTEGSIQNNLNTSIYQQSGVNNISKNIQQHNTPSMMNQYGSINNKNLQIQTIPDNLDDLALNFQIASRKNRNASVRNNPSFYYNRGEKLMTIQNDYEDISINPRYSNAQSSQGNHSNYPQYQYSQSPSRPEKKSIFPQSSKHSTNQQLFEKSVLFQKEKQELLSKEQLYRQKFIQQQLQKRNANGIDSSNQPANTSINRLSSQANKEEKIRNQKSILSRNSESPQESLESSYNNNNNNQDSFLQEHKPSHNISKDINQINDNIQIQINKQPQLKIEKRQSRLGQQDVLQEAELQLLKKQQQEHQQEQRVEKRQVQSKEKKQEQLPQTQQIAQNTNDSTNEKLVHPKSKWDLSDEEWNNFGDRFPKTLIKKKLLGRGGFALVWLGEDKKTKENYAIKQIQSSNAHQTHIKEIWFGSFFFKNGIPKEKFLQYRGIDNLSKMMMHDIKPIDTWIYYELCGESLGSSLYELKGEGYRGDERVYRVHYKKLYQSIKKDLKQFKKLVFELAHALWLLSDQRIVHSDLKTENILVKTKEVGGNVEIEQVKLIDYGSSFTFGNLKHFSMATPEYMAPEILNFILYQNQLRHLPNLLEYLKNYQKTYVIDIWSLGCVMMEIISGIPLWMSLKTIVKHKGQELIRHGLFAAKGRVFESIIEKQIEVVKNMDTYIDDHNYSGVVVDDDLRYLVKKMLILDPAKRISPKEVCQYLHKSVLNTPFVDIQINEEVVPPQNTKNNTQSTVSSAKYEANSKTESFSYQNNDNNNNYNNINNNNNNKNEEVKSELQSPTS